ncbi:MAG: HAD family hydrolase [Chloroflexi bacterium]|nr:HAD family hydrolase [Chloroflexota bacterium]
MIDTLIFDFDGVVIDTETTEYSTWQEVFERFGQSLDRDVWSEIIGGGVKWFDPIEDLESLVGPLPDRDGVRTRRRERNLDLIDANSVLPGVLDYIDEARHMGLKLGVASSSTREWVEGHLAKRGLLEYFGAIATRDQVSNVKPDPELYLTVVEGLGSKPDNAVAIEDSYHGVTAAKRAGLWCVAVPNPMTRDMDFDQADILLDSLSDLPLDSLLARLAEAVR